MDNNVIFRARLVQNPIPNLEIQFGQEGQDIRYNNDPVGENPFIWNQGLDHGSRAVISLLDRTITRGSFEDPNGGAVPIGQELTLRDLGNNQYRYSTTNDTAHTITNLSTITLQGQNNMMKVRLECLTEFKY